MTREELEQIENWPGYIHGIEWVSDLEARGEKVPLLAAEIRKLWAERDRLAGRLDRLIVQLERGQ